MSKPQPISEIAKTLGLRGGEKTRKRLDTDPEYYKRIGGLGGKAKHRKAFDRKLEGAVENSIRKYGKTYKMLAEK